MSVLLQLVRPYHLNCIPLQHLHKALNLVLPVLLQDRTPNKETRAFAPCNVRIILLSQRITQDKKYEKLFFYQDQHWFIWGKFITSWVLRCSKIFLMKNLFLTSPLEHCLVNIFRRSVSLECGQKSHRRSFSHKKLFTAVIRLTVFWKIFLYFRYNLYFYLYLIFFIVAARSITLNI